MNKCVAGIEVRMCSTGFTSIHNKVSFIIMQDQIASYYDKVYYIDLCSYVHL